MDLVEQLYQDYVAYWRRCGATRQIEKRLGRLPPPPQLTRERQGALIDMAQYCLDHGADPRLWLYTLFAARVWMYAPKWTCLTPKTHLARYKKEQRLEFFRERIDQERRERRAAQDDVFDPNVDISAHVEALKGQYVRTGRTDACMATMRSETFGFHPKSNVCRQCPAQTPCQASLAQSVPFDIVALRRGDVSVEQARQALLAQKAAQDGFYGRF